MSTEQEIPVGATGLNLRSFEQVTTAGTVQVEAISVVDPTNVAAQQKVTNAAPSGADYGSVTWIQGTVAVTGAFFQATQPVSGTFFQATQPISAAALPLPAGAATSTLQTQPGVDIGDVTINNAAGVAAVNIQDGGNIITVDGTVAVSGAVAVTGTFFQGTQPVSLAINTPDVTDRVARVLGVASVANLDVALSTRLKPADTLAAVTSITNVVHVDDNAGSLTVDAPVGTPLFARLSDGAAALIGQKAMASSLPVVLASDQASIPVAATLAAETVKVIGAVNQGTSPWVVGSNKTNNNAAPGATNIGALDGLANAAVPAWTEGNQVLLSTDLAGALRAISRPMVMLGAYRLAAQTAVYTALGAGAILYSFRWTDATKICFVSRVRVAVNTTTASGAAGMIDRDLVIVRAFTVADSGGTAITLTTNNQKLRTSQATTVVGGIQISSGGALAAGTGTADAQAIGLVTKQGLAAEPVGLTIAPEDLFSYNVDQNYPIILAANEGFRIRIPTAMPTTIAQRTTVTVEWGELATATAY